MKSALLIHTVQHLKHFVFTETILTVTVLPVFSPFGDSLNIVNLQFHGFINKS